MFSKSYEADVVVVVLPGRRILKVVAKVIFNGYSTGFHEPEVPCIGTKRSRAIMSGADEQLEDEGEEEDDDEEMIFLPMLHLLVHVKAQSLTVHFGHG